MNWWKKTLLGLGFAATVGSVSAQEIRGTVTDNQTGAGLENILVTMKSANDTTKVKEDYTEINKIYLDIFSYCDKLGIKLSETKDYYLLFKIIKTLQED